MIKEKLKESFDNEEERHPKTTFWPSDSETPFFSLWHAFKNSKKTPPPIARQLIWDVGERVENAVIERLKDSVEQAQARIEIEREGVQITGNCDAIMKSGAVLEVKSMHGYAHNKELKNSKPKTSYLKQLCIYLDGLEREKGILFHVDKGSGYQYEFEVEQAGERIYKCGNIVIDLNEVYKRYADFKAKYLDPGVEPPLDFDAKWQVEWSPYYDLIINHKDYPALYKKLTKK